MRKFFDRFYTTIAVLFVALASILIAAYAYGADNPNYGKADDYGSDRFRAVNHCMVEGISNKQKPDKTGAGLTPCMNSLGFDFCDNCQVFGNSGPKCGKDEQKHFHSWCWTKSE